MVKKSIEQIEAFWDDNLCGKKFVGSSYLSEEFFELYTAFRYRKTHHLNEYINWRDAHQKKILEIGLGIGADSCRWAEYAGEYVGVDLTKEAVEATRKHLAIKNLRGTVLQANAERLPFDNQQFKMVYSYGVLHHTTNIKQAFKEVKRVLDKDGTFIVMLYNKASFNYWFRIQFYFRLMFLLSLVKRMVGINVKGDWAKHLDNFNTMGWAYFGWKEWPHHCTDGPDCEVANIYTKKKALKMLTDVGFTIEKTRIAHLPVGLSPKIERILASFLGFHLIIWAKN